MNATASPLQVVSRIYDAMARKDIDALLELVDPAVVITQDDALPWGGRHAGREGLVEFSLALVGNIDSAVSAEAMFQAGEQVVQYGRTRGTVRANGAAFDIPECHVWTVRDGRAVAADFFIDSAAMLDALATNAPG